MTIITKEEYMARKAEATEQLLAGKITEEEFTAYSAELDARYTAPTEAVEASAPEFTVEAENSVEEEDIDEDTIFGIATVGVGAINNGKRGTKKNSKVLMSVYFEDSDNQRFIPLDKFFDSIIQGKSLAEWLALGKKVHLSHIQYGKHKLFLGLDGVAGQDFSIDPRADSWMCPACSSAHGTGVKSSGSSGDKTPNTSALRSSLNKVFLNLETRTIQIFSTSCWNKYVIESLPKERVNAIFAPATPSEIKILSRQRKAG